MPVVKRAMAISGVLSFGWCAVSAVAMASDNHTNELISLVILFPVLAGCSFAAIMITTMLIRHFSGQGSASREARLRPGPRPHDQTDASA